VVEEEGQEEEEEVKKGQEEKQRLPIRLCLGGRDGWEAG